MSKKVVIVLVEGASDEEFLIGRMRELYEGCEIRFEPQREDVFYNEKARQKSIKLVIGDIVREVVKKRKYRDSDILAVLHVIDTDGCLIPENCIEINHDQQEKTYYSVDTIKVNSSKQKQNIIKRNDIRSSHVKTMNKQQKVVSKKYKYQLYYFSRNLEHVLFNEPNPKQENKYENVEEFIENLDCTVEEFLYKYLPGIEGFDYSDKYNSSWRYVEEGVNSLKRATNVPLLFEFINTLVD